MNIFSRQYPFPGFIPFLRFLLIIFLLSILLLFFHLPASAKTFFSIRLASYKDKSAAIKQVNELKKLGHNAFMKTVSLKGKGTWHRVYIERYDTRDEAVKEARIFKKLELIAEYGIDPIHEKETPAGKTETVQKSLFLLGFSYQDKKNAEKNVDMLRDEGHKAFYVKEEIRGTNGYQVYVGKFGSQSLARKAGSTLIKKGLIPYFKTVKIPRNIN